MVDNKTVVLSWYMWSCDDMELLCTRRTSIPAIWNKETEVQQAAPFLSSLQEQLQWFFYIYWSRLSFLIYVLFDNMICATDKTVSNLVFLKTNFDDRLHVRELCPQVHNFLRTNLCLRYHPAQQPFSAHIIAETTTVKFWRARTACRVVRRHHIFCIFGTSTVHTLCIHCFYVIADITWSSCPFWIQNIVFWLFRITDDFENKLNHLIGY